MTPQELRRQIERLGISQVRAAGYLRVDPRTVRRWLAGDTPIPYAAFLALMAYEPDFSKAPLTPELGQERQA